jgi:cysteine-rich repeat protein
MRETLARVLGSICAASVVIGGAGCAQLLGLGDLTFVDSEECPTAPPDTVIACATITHVRPDGTTYTSRKDLSHFTVAAYIVDTGASGFRVVSGTAGSDGIARIDGVPDGTPYYFRLQDPQDSQYPWPHYFYTDKRTLDIGNAQIGRDDTPAISDTEVTVDMTAMTPWKAGDGTTLVSFQSGTEVSLFPDPFPAIGATAYRQTIDWRSGRGETTLADFTDAGTRLAQLINQGPDHNDDLWMLHTTLVTMPDEANQGVRVGTIADALGLSGVTMTNGSAITVGGAFQRAPASPNPLMISVNAAPFRAAFRDANRYMIEEIRCSLYATPAASMGLTLGSAALASIVAPQMVANHPGLRLTIPYTNPFPSNWPQLMHCSMGHQRLAKIPGTSRTSFGYSYITSYTPGSNNFIWTPQVQAITNLKIGGSDGIAGGAVPFDGVAPVTISWDPVPGVTHYQIRIKDETSTLFVGVFDTTQSQVSIPADTFTRGNFYVFRVFAIQTTGDYVAGKLLDFQVPLWSARVSTGMFRFSDACGNTVTDRGEDCDPGPNGSSAACDADCSAVSCGDGFLNAAAGEDCDDVFASPNCGTDCKAPRCGDNAWNPLAAEECDDGNAIAGDGCTTACKLERCGNRMPDPFETCDDGNRINGDGCDAFCQEEPLLQ